MIFDLLLFIPQPPATKYYINAALGYVLMLNGTFRCHFLMENSLERNHQNSIFANIIRTILAWGDFSGEKPRFD